MQIYYVIPFASEPLVSRDPTWQPCLFTRISLREEESQNSSQAHLIFHGIEKGEDHYALYFDVTVNVSNFTENTTYVTADVFIRASRGPFIKISKQMQFPVIMPVKPTAFRIVGKWWFWLLLVP